MAKQTISLGTAPNDGTGDNLRIAGGKINDNFNELYGGLQSVTTVNVSINSGEDYTHETSSSVEPKIVQVFDPDGWQMLIRKVYDTTWKIFIPTVEVTGTYRIFMVY